MGEKLWVKMKMTMMNLQESNEMILLFIYSNNFRKMCHNHVAQSANRKALIICNWRQSQVCGHT